MNRRRTRALAPFLSGLVALGLLLPAAATSLAAGNIVELSVSADKNVISPGDKFTLTAAISNTSAATSTQVELRARVPTDGVVRPDGAKAATMTVASQLPADTTCSSLETEIVCALPNLKAGERPRTLAFTVQTGPVEGETLAAVQGALTYDWVATAKQRTVSGQQTGVAPVSGHVDVSSRDDESVVIDFHDGQPFTFQTAEANGGDNLESAKATIPYNPAVDGQRARICEAPTATTCPAVKVACEPVPTLDDPLLTLDRCFSNVFLVTIPGTYSGGSTSEDYLKLQFTMSNSQLPQGVFPSLVEIYKRNSAGEYVALDDCDNTPPRPDEDSPTCEWEEQLAIDDDKGTFTITVLTTNNGEYRAG